MDRILPDMRIRRSTSVLLGAWIATFAFSGVEIAVQRHIDALLRQLTDPSVDHEPLYAAIEGLRTWWTFDAFAGAALLALIAFGARRAGGRLGVVVMGGALVTLVTGLLPTVMQAIDETWLLSEGARTFQSVLWAVGLGTYLVTRLGSLAIAWRAAGARSVAQHVAIGVAALGALGGAGLLVAQWIAEWERSSTIGLARMALTIFAEGGVVAALALAWRSQPAEAPRETTGAWASTAAGVRLYGTALTLRVVVAASLYTLVLFAIVGRSASTMQTLGWIALPVELIASLVLVAGIYKLTDAPDREVAGWAWAAVGATALGIVVQLFAFVHAQELVKRVAAMSWGDREGLEASLKALRLAEAASVVIGVGGAIAVLASLRAVADRRGHVTLAARAVTLMVLVAVATAFAAGARWMLSDPEAVSRRSVSTTLLVAALAVTAALSTLVAVISFVRALSRALDEQVIGSA